MSRTRLNDDFARQVLSVVEKIPAGSVATYGQLACLIGRPKNARLVARVLSHAEYYGHFPCHRVVRRDGAVSPAFAFGGSNRQVELLKNEGVEFTDESHVDMARFCVRALPYIAE